jgi:hypothetical protein
VVNERGSSLVIGKGLVHACDGKGRFGLGGGGLKRGMWLGRIEF